MGRVPSWCRRTARGRQAITHYELIESYPAQARGLKDPRVKLYVGDGRKILRQMPPGHYDLVVMNTTWHWRAYVSMLLSQEFLTLMRSRMAPDGLIAFNTTGSPDALRTAAEVFPHAYLYDSFAFASAYDWRKLLTDPAAPGRLMQVKPDGQAIFTAADGDLIADFLSPLRVHDLAAVTAKAGRQPEVITDRNLITEYRYGR